MSRPASLKEIDKRLFERSGTVTTVHKPSWNTCWPRSKRKDQTIKSRCVYILTQHVELLLLSNASSRVTVAVLSGTNVAKHIIAVTQSVIAWWENQLYGSLEPRLRSKYIITTDVAKRFHSHVFKKTIITKRIPWVPEGFLQKTFWGTKRIVFVGEYRFPPGG